MKKTSFIATGDAFITRRFPEGGYEGFEAVRDCIMQHDVKVSNLEMTFHDHEGYPAAFSGGTWAMADPRTLDDMKTFTIQPTTTPMITAMAAFWPPSSIYGNGI